MKITITSPSWVVPDFRDATLRWARESYRALDARLTVELWREDDGATRTYVSLDGHAQRLKNDGTDTGHPAKRLHDSDVLRWLTRDEFEVLELDILQQSNDALFPTLVEEIDGALLEYADKHWPEEAGK